MELDGKTIAWSINDKVDILIKYLKYFSGILDEYIINASCDNEAKILCRNILLKNYSLLRSTANLLNDIEKQWTNIHPIYLMCRAMVLDSIILATVADKYEGEVDETLSNYLMCIKADHIYHLYRNAESKKEKQKILEVHETYFDGSKEKYKRLPSVKSIISSITNDELRHNSLSALKPYFFFSKFEHYGYYTETILNKEINPSKEPRYDVIELYIIGAIHYVMLINFYGAQFFILDIDRQKLEDLQKGCVFQFSIVEDIKFQKS